MHVAVRDRNALGKGFITKYEDGRYVGPLGVVLNTPAVGHGFLATNQAINQIPGLSPKCKEIAILVAAAKDKSAYEMYAHTVLGKSRGITIEEIGSMMQIEQPQSFSEEEKTVYDVARELVSGEGPLPKPTWDKAMGLLGKDGVTALVHLVGFYSYVCVLLRGVDCQVPDEDDQKSQ